MSFDTTNKKIGLLEAAAKYFIIRDQITNDSYDFSELNFNIKQSVNEAAATAAITAYILQALCQISAANHLISNYCLHFPSLKDEPFTREKLKIF